MSTSGPAPGHQNESLDELFGSVFDLAGQITSRITPRDIESRLRRTIREADRPDADWLASPVLTDSSSTVRLVGDAAAGNQQAWNLIVERYAPLVYTTCRRYCLADHDIEDVGQRVWLRLVEHIGSLRDPAALPGWLATTTARECLRVLQSKRPNQLPEDWANLAVDDAAIDAQILAAEQNVALHRAMATLPPRYRQLLLLLVSDPPLSYAEISSRLGIPIGSIGPQRSRCLQRLRRSLPLALYRYAFGEGKHGSPSAPRQPPLPG